MLILLCHCTQIIADKSQPCLQATQNAMIRLLTDKQVSWHFILFIDSQFILELILIFSPLHGQPPDYMTQLLVKHKTVYCLRSQAQNLIAVPHKTEDQGRQGSFSVCGSNALEQFSSI